MHKGRKSTYALTRWAPLKMQKLCKKNFFFLKQLVLFVECLFNLFSKDRKYMQHELASIAAKLYAKVEILLCSIAYSLHMIP